MTVIVEVNRRVEAKVKCSINIKLSVLKKQRKKVYDFCRKQKRFCNRDESDVMDPRNCRCPPDPFSVERYAEWSDLSQLTRGYFNYFLYLRACPLAS